MTLTLRKPVAKEKSAISDKCEGNSLSNRSASSLVNQRSRLI